MSELFRVGNIFGIYERFFAYQKSVRRRTKLADLGICDKKHGKGANSFRREHKNVTFSMDCMSIACVTNPTGGL